MPRRQKTTIFKLRLPSRKSVTGDDGLFGKPRQLRRKEEKESQEREKDEGERRKEGERRGRREEDAVHTHTPANKQTWTILRIVSNDR